MYASHEEPCGRDTPTIVSTAAGRPHLAVTREKPSVSELRPLRENGLPLCYACYKLALLFF